MLWRSMIIAALALGVAVPQAQAALADEAATHAYIQADFALARASVAEIHPGEARIARLTSALAGECPGIGAGSPEDEASQPMDYDVAVALWSIAYGTDAGPIRSFDAAVRGLRWSNHHITQVAQRYASDLHELATLAQPNLCADVRAWRENGFQAIPPGVSAVDQRVEAIEPKPMPGALLAPYERGSDARTFARAAQLENELAVNETVIGYNDWERVIDTLGLRL